MVDDREAGVGNVWGEGGGGRKEHGPKWCTRSCVEATGGILAHFWGKKW
jgi:hypothetical protein